MSTAPKVLLVEDEPDAGAVLKDYLRQSGYQVAWVQTGAEALALLATEGPHLQAAILDAMVPPPDGPALLRHIRQTPGLEHLPVLFLTARSEEAAELQALAAGADDYIGKPASLNKVATRLEALLRRAGPAAETPLVHDAANRRIVAHGRALELTAAEYHLLAQLLDHPSRVFTRQELLQSASPEPDEALERTVDAHIKNIRAKLGPLGSYIRTYRGLGYGLTLGA